MKHSDLVFYRDLFFLRRRFTAKTRRFPPSMDPIALADVVLLVLLFFISSSAYVRHSGVKIQVPQSAHLEGIPLNAVVVTVSQGGMTFLNDQRISDGELPARFKRIAQAEKAPPLFIEADERVSYKKLMDIVGAARDAGLECHLSARRAGTSPVPSTE